MSYCPSCADLQSELTQARAQRDALVNGLKQIELLARVNAPINDGSPMHKAESPSVVTEEPK